MKTADIQIDANIARRLTAEARRRAPVTADGRVVVRQLVHGVLAELLERLEDEDLPHPPSRWCRCPTCAPIEPPEPHVHAWTIEDDGARCACGIFRPFAMPRLADGTAPGTERLHGDRCTCAGAGCRERPAR